MTSFATFHELQLEDSLTKALDKMGFTEPTPIQQQTIMQALDGRDILGCAQTGTGKTGAFGIPLIQYLIKNPDKKALILAPTRELADQINRTLALMAFNSYGIRIALIIGGASMGQQVRMLSQGARVIVATPGRLIDLLSQRKVALGNVGILVLDEVDRMLDMGFAPQLEQIVPHLPSERQAMLFSATLPPEIMKLAESYLRNPVRVTVGEQLAAATTVEQKMIQTQQDSKQELLLKELTDMQGKAIVFVKTQHGTERLAKVVRAAGFRADRLHGGRTHMQRKRALDNFRKGETQILVATDIAGRGIDIDDIEFVVNFDMPKTQEDYIHRIGRTGRYGRTGVAINFVTYEDMRLMRLLDPESYPSRRGPSSGTAGSGMRRGSRDAGGYNDRRAAPPSGRRPETTRGRASDARSPSARGGEGQRRDRPSAASSGREPRSFSPDARRDRPSAPRGDRPESRPRTGSAPRPPVAAAAAANDKGFSRTRREIDTFDGGNTKPRRSGADDKASVSKPEAPKKSRLANLFRWE